MGNKQTKKPSGIDKVDSSFDWKTLKRGDEIFLKPGEGPYCECTKDDGSIVREPMGHYGRFRVNSVTSEGIHIYDEYGHGFAYFGPRKVMASGTVMESHRITKVKRHE